MTRSVLDLLPRQNLSNINGMSSAEMPDPVSLTAIRIPLELVSPKGAVLVSSEIGKGTTFVIELPVDHT